MAWLYTAAAVALLPWIAYLAVSLPRRNLDTHYRAAWVGFDLLLGFAIVRTAYMAFRVDQRVQFPAIATATLLIVDAWFDVTTSSGRGQVIEALVLAACFELPAALFSLYLAREVNRHIWELAVAGRAAEMRTEAAASARGAPPHGDSAPESQPQRESRPPPVAPTPTPSSDPDARPIS